MDDPAALRRRRAARRISRNTCGSRGLFADWVDASDRFERVAPVPFSVVCFRLRDRDGSAGDAEHSRILDAVNASGEVFLSHTRLDGRFVLRLAIGNLHTTERHVARAWELLNSAAGSH